MKSMTKIEAVSTIHWACKWDKWNKQRINDVVDALFFLGLTAKEIPLAMEKMEFYWDKGVAMMNDRIQKRFAGFIFEK